MTMLKIVTTILSGEPYHPVTKRGGGGWSGVQLCQSAADERGDYNDDDYNKVDYNDDDEGFDDDADVQAIVNGEFIEHATFAGNTYGTSTIAVQRVRDKGQHNFCVNFHFLDNHQMLFNIAFTFPFSLMG